MNDNEKAPIDFWFDFSSPYGYLLAEKLDDVAAKHGSVNVFIGIVVVREGKRYKQAGVCHVALEGRLLHAE